MTTDRELLAGFDWYVPPREAEIDDNKRERKLTADLANPSDMCEHCASSFDDGDVVLRDRQTVFCNRQCADANDRWLRRVQEAWQR